MAFEAENDSQEQQIPDRMFFKIGEVSKITGVKTHVLRFWENQFSTLSPRKTSNGQRQYRRKDVEMVLTLKKLLYKEGYTIPGVKRVLLAKIHAAAAKKAPESRNVSAIQASGPALAEIRAELEEILRILDGEKQPETR